MPLYIAQRGDLGRCYRCLTDGQTLKDRATQLLIKYKTGALVTQLYVHYRMDFVMHLMHYYLFWTMEKLHLTPTEQLLTSQDGMVFLVDRKKELIKVKGFQVIQFCRPLITTGEYQGCPC